MAIQTRSVTRRAKKGESTPKKSTKPKTPPKTESSKSERRVNAMVKGPPRKARKRKLTTKGSWPDLKLGLTNFALVHLSEYSRRLVEKLREIRNKGALSEQKADMMLALGIHISNNLERFMHNMPRHWSLLGRIRVHVSKMQNQLEEILTYDPDHYETYVLQSNVQAMRIWLSRATIGMALCGYQVALYHALQLRRHLTPKLTNKRRPEIKREFREALIKLVNHVKECYSRWKVIEDRLASKNENSLSIEELRELLVEWHKVSRRIPSFVHVFISKIPDGKRKTFKDDIGFINRFLMSSERLSSPQFIDEHVLYEAGEHDKHLEQIHSFDRASLITPDPATSTLTEPQSDFSGLSGNYDLTPTWKQLISSYHPEMLAPKVIS